MDPILFYIPTLLGEVPIVSAYLISKKPVQGVIEGHRHVEFPKLFIRDCSEVMDGFEECVECKHCYPKAIVNSTDKICVACRYIKNGREITDETIAKIRNIINCSAWLGTYDIYGVISVGGHFMFAGEYHENDAKYMGLFMLIKSLMKPSMADQYEALGVDHGIDEALKGAERAISYMFQGCTSNAYVRSLRNVWCDDVAYIAMANRLKNYVWRVTAGIFISRDEDDIECSRCFNRVPVNRVKKHYMNHITEAMPELKESGYLSNITVYTSNAVRAIKHRYKITIYREML